MISCKEASSGGESVTKDTVTATNQSLDVYHPYFYDSAFVALRVLKECPNTPLTKDYEGWADIRPSYRQNWMDRLKLKKKDSPKDGPNHKPLTVQQAYYTCVFSTAWTTAIEFCSQIFGCSIALGDPMKEPSAGRDQCVEEWNKLNKIVTVSDKFYQRTCNDIYGISKSQ